MSEIPHIKIESFSSAGGRAATVLYIDGYQIHGVQELAFHHALSGEPPALAINFIADRKIIGEKDHSEPDSHNLFGDLSPDELAKLGERLRETMDDVPLTLRPPETYKEN